MTTDLLATLLTTQFLLFSHPAPPDPCGLVSSTEIASALGSKPSPGRTVGPSVDEETGTKVSACSWKVDDLFLSIDVDEFRTAAAAAAALTESGKLSMEVEEVMKLSPQAGLGDGALWGASPEGALWGAVKGKYMLNVALAGELGDGGRYRDPLKRLASLALTRL